MFSGSKTTADGDCSHETKRRFLLRRKTMTDLDRILESRDITVTTKVYIIKAMVFLVVMYGSVQLRPTLCDPMDYMIHGVLQARILEWVAFPFSRGSFQPRD